MSLHILSCILYAGWLCGVGWVLYMSIRDLVREWREL